MMADQNHGPERLVQLTLAVPEHVAAWLERHAGDEEEMCELAVSMIEMIIEDDLLAHASIH